MKTGFSAGDLIPQYKWRWNDKEDNTVTEIQSSAPLNKANQTTFQEAQSTQEGKKKLPALSVIFLSKHQHTTESNCQMRYINKALLSHNFHEDYSEYDLNAQNSSKK